MMDEKRRFTRIPFKVKADLEVGSDKFQAPVIDDLSIGGCCLPVNTGLEAGAECRVGIIMENAENTLKVDVYGKIVRCSPDKVVIKFTKIDPDSLFHLQNIIRFNSPDADIIDQEIKKHPGLI